MDNINRSTNTPIIVLLTAILIAVLGFGGYFLARDIISINNGSSQTQNTDNNNSGQGNTDPSSGDSGNSGSGGSSDQPIIADIDASITIAETQGVNFHIEAQTSGIVDGKCDVTLTPTDGTQGHHDVVDLNVVGQNSVCSEDISLKGLNPGEHRLTIVVLAADGRTKTLAQTLRI